jgi:ABC-2 type transport system permease protein
VLELTRDPAIRVFAEPVDVQTPGGYATWRMALVLPMLAIWALMAVSRTTRGEEESGAFDLLLSVAGSRLTVTAQRLAALATALVGIGVLIGALTLAGARATHVELEAGLALLFGFNATLFALVFGGSRSSCRNSRASGVRRPARPAPCWGHRSSSPARAARGPMPNGSGGSRRSTTSS